MAKRENKNSDIIKEIQRETDGIENYSGFALYQELRNRIFNSVKISIQQNNQKKCDTLFNMSEYFNGEMDILFKSGFFNPAYEDNLILATDIFSSNFKDENNTKFLLSRLDIYVRPKSEKTEEFINSMDKSLSGILAYLLSQFEECSEHLSIHIAKQAFKHKSDQTVYHSLGKIKKLPNQKISALAKLFLFGRLFFKSVEWDQIKPRAKQSRSIMELKRGLDSLTKLRENIIKEDIKSAQTALQTNKKQFSKIIRTELIDEIHKYPDKPIKINDEFVFAVLFLNYFGNTLTSALLPDPN
jgi:hypothetical protein